MIYHPEIADLISKQSTNLYGCDLSGQTSDIMMRVWIRFYMNSVRVYKWDNLFLIIIIFFSLWVLFSLYIFML